MRLNQSLLGLVVSLLLSHIFCHAQTTPPNDANKYQLVVVGPADGPAKWFDTDSKLNAIKKRSAFTSYAPNSVLFRERFENRLGSDFPIVAYLRPDGGVIYFADANTMPAKDSLYDEIKAAVIKAREAIPAKQPQELQQEVESELDSIMGDCPDGQCVPPSTDSRPLLFPKIRPRVQQPFDRLAEGFFSNAIGSGIWLVFAIIALGFVFFFFILLLAAIYLVSRLFR